MLIQLFIDGRCWLMPSSKGNSFGASLKWFYTIQEITVGRTAVYLEVLINTNKWVFGLSSTGLWTLRRFSMSHTTPKQSPAVLLGNAFVAFFFFFFAQESWVQFGGTPLPPSCFKTQWHTFTRLVNVTSLHQVHYTFCYTGYCRDWLLVCRIIPLILSSIQAYLNISQNCSSSLFTYMKSIELKQ